MPQRRAVPTRPQIYTPRRPETHALSPPPAAHARRGRRGQGHAERLRPRHGPRHIHEHSQSVRVTRVCVRRHAHTPARAHMRACARPHRPACARGQTDRQARLGRGGRGETTRARARTCVQPRAQKETDADGRTDGRTDTTGTRAQQMRAGGKAGGRAGRRAGRRRRKPADTAVCVRARKRAAAYLRPVKAQDPRAAMRSHQRTRERDLSRVLAASRAAARSHQRTHGHEQRAATRPKTSRHRTRRREASSSREADRNKSQ